VALEEAQTDLQQTFPGWQIWFVRHAVGGLVTWCAQRLPLLEADNAGALAEAIVAAEGSATVPLADTLSMDVPTNGEARLPALDRLRNELRATFPNWHTTYTPYVGGGVTWHARRGAVLHADSPEGLAWEIRSADGSGHSSVIGLA
jgi:hypothetical protein